jgi:hypothetical protein
MESFITTLRRQVRDLFRAEGTLPVYGFLPDDVAHLPCYVVGRPSISESGTAAVMTVTMDVIVLGRRVGDEDAQAELDGYGDEAFDVLGCTRGVKIADGQLLACRSVTAASVNVAGNDIPCYSLSVDTDILTC